MSERKPPLLQTSRRTLFRSLAALPAAGLLVGCKGPDDTTPPTAPTADTGLPTDPRDEEPTSPWEGSVPVDDAQFPLGAQTGEPLPDGFVAWTFAPGADTVLFQLARWDGATWVEEDVIDGQADSNGYVHVEPSGLLPGTAYAVQALVDGAGSAVAHARTAPDLDARPEVRLGGISCNDQNHGEFPALDALQDLGPIDAMLWLGDTVYADGRTTHEAYRELWQEQLGKGTMQRILHAAAGVWTWDDHEVDNNWDPQTFDAQNLEAAVDTFFETVPFPATVRSTTQLWRTLRFGRTVELFMLDVRSERDRAAGHYVSPAQLDWLTQGLTNSPCVWKVIVTSVPITDWPLAYDAANAHLDRWDGFESTQRQELLDHIVDTGVSGVFFVSGDLHQSTLSYVDPPGGKAERLLEFLVGPGGSFINVVARLLDDAQFPYADADWSAGRMVFRPDGTARLQTVHEDGQQMMEAVIDLEGNVTLELERHPWNEAD